MSNPMISVLIPAKSTASFLAQTVDTLSAFFVDQNISTFEIILILNGERNESYRAQEKVAFELAQKVQSLKIVHVNEGLKGKGIALKKGFEVSSGEWIYFMDADLPYDLDFFIKAAEFLKTGSDVVLGNRRATESTFVVPVPLLPLVYKRHRLSLWFNKCLRLLLPLRERDTQAGIRAMTRSFAKTAFALQTCPGFFFDIEHFIIANKNDFIKTEIPLHLTLRNEKSTVRLFVDGLKAIAWIFRITLQNLKGNYDLKKNLLKNYSSLSWQTQFYLKLRYWLTPYHEMAQYFPRQGKILDMGCGHGLFSSVLALTRAQCAITGIDHDARRWTQTQNAHKSIENLHFELADVLNYSALQKYNGVAIIDVLHYLSAEQQETLLKNVFDFLTEDGVLVMREVDASPSLKSSWNQFYEYLATQVGFTKSKNDTTNFRTPDEWATLMRTIGYSVSWKKCSSIFFTDILFVATKKETKLAHKNSKANTISADDWGMSPAINRGILRLAQLGIVRRVSILADGKYVDTHLDDLKKIKHIQLGLHFDLTSKKTISLWWLLTKAYIPLLHSKQWAKNIQEEFHRQMDILETKGLQIQHMDGHHHVHVFPNILKHLAPIAVKRGIQSMRLPNDQNLKTTSKFILPYLSGPASDILDKHQILYQSFFYPMPKHFLNKNIFLQEISNKQNYEIIVHPADENDAHLHGEKNGEARVDEYLALQNIHISSRSSMPEF